jgi:regulator of RNase E activity RraA
MTTSHQQPDPSAERLALIHERLSTAVIGDILDQVGFIHQFLPPEIRALEPAMVVVGRAMPVVVGRVRPKDQPFGRLTEALDQLGPHEVYLADGGGVPAAAWGELLTATARARGAVGAVIDGYHRDTAKVLQQGWPVFSRGAYAQDARARSAVLDFRVPLTIGDVRVEPGDLVVGDVDGVVIVPAVVEAEVITRALEKASVETEVRSRIDEGMSSSAAFDRYGVL